MNDILALGGLSGLTGAPVSRTGGEGGSGRLFGELLTSVLCSRRCGGSDRPPSLGRRRRLCFGRGRHGACSLCMLMLNSNGGAGLRPRLRPSCRRNGGHARDGLGEERGACTDGAGCRANEHGGRWMIPYESWKPVNPAAPARRRGAMNYRAVIDQFRVETLNGRYKVNKQGRATRTAIPSCGRHSAMGSRSRITWTRKPGNRAPTPTPPALFA